MLNIIIGILEYENIKYEPITDIEILLKHSRVHTNPTDVCGVYVFKGSQVSIITDFYEAIKYIDKKELKPN